MEKQVYYLAKALKEFRVYILHSNVIVVVPSITIKDILTKSNPDGSRANQIAVLLEYGLEIKPTKFIKGEGLVKMMVRLNYDALDINLLDDDLTFSTHLEHVKI